MPQIIIAFFTLTSAGTWYEESTPVGTRPIHRHDNHKCNGTWPMSIKHHVIQSSVNELCKNMMIL